MVKRLARKDALCVIVHQHLAEQVQRVLAAEVLVVGFDELAPWFDRRSEYERKLLSQQSDELLVEFQMVLLDILEEIIRA